MNEICYFCHSTCCYGILTIRNKTKKEHTLGTIILKPNETVQIGICDKCVQQIEPMN